MRTPKPDGGGVPYITLLADHKYWKKSDVNPVDGRVGRQLRARRVECGMGEESLASSLGVSVYQLKQFEAGSKRIGAKKLLDLCHILSCRPEYFFERVTLREVNN